MCRWELQMHLGRLTWQGVRRRRRTGHEAHSGCSSVTASRQSILLMSHQSCTTDSPQLHGAQKKYRQHTFSWSQPYERLGINCRRLDNKRKQRTAFSSDVEPVCLENGPHSYLHMKFDNWQAQSSGSAALPREFVNAVQNLKRGEEVSRRHR